MEKQNENVQEGTETVEQVDTQQEEVKAQDKSVKTFTQEELDAVIKSNVDRALAKARKEAKEQLDEAEKVRKMNAEQKAKYEIEKRDNYIKQLEAERNRSNMEREATTLLQERNITVNHDVLNFVVKETAEETLTAIEHFEKVLNDLADKKVQTLLKGRTPTSTKARVAGVTKAEFEAMSYSQRVQLKENNPKLYAELSNK